MLESLLQSSLAACAVIFAVSALAIATFGIRMTYVSRDLAQLTGLGEAFMGAVLIGAATSLSGIIASCTAAWHGEGALAVSNSLGGIASQTMFLVLGDFLYRKANLEYVAASVENLMMAAQLMLLLSLLYVGFLIPDLAIGHVHPVSIILVAAYLTTVKMLVDAHDRPMWLPRIERGTLKPVRKKAPRPQKKDLGKLYGQFLGCAAVVAVSGWLIANSGMEIIRQTGMSTGIMGGLFIAISTSLPELVIAITAVRIGALMLAVGDIVGGNAFDTLFVAVSDIFFRQGSIFTTIGQDENIWLGTAMVMNALLLLGLIYRERKGIANIGMESFSIMVVYLTAVTYMALA